MAGWTRKSFELTKRIAVAIAKPLQRGNGPNKFRLSAVDTATTTYDGSEGWASRPPAIFECPQCGGEISQRNARDDIDCPHCTAEFSYDESRDLELKRLTCPTCRSEMVYGQRHPESFDVVEWATCNGCRYHWEFKHSYS